MSMEHTPEQWKLFTEMNSATIKRTTWHEDDPSIGDTSYVAKLNDNWICDEHGGSAHANGRRIVASVNACAGIPTEALESGVVAEMRDCLDTLLHETYDWDLNNGRGLTAEETALRERCLALFAKLGQE